MSSTSEEGLSDLRRLSERLRAPDGCPWDREQTHRSLRPHLLEESYEALEALDAGDDDRLADELGDLLFQIVIHAEIAREAGAFDLAEVERRIVAKLIRRHPHVFADRPIEGDLLAQWERIKRGEREAHAGAATTARSASEAPGGETPRSLLDGIPKALPALFAAERLQERAARVHLVPPRVQLPLDVDDEAFLGDVLFDLVADARDRGFDAETALRAANARFAARVARVEARVRTEGRALEAYAADELAKLWEDCA
ncbi:MAG: MazG family protein [Chloroflexi bacterium]|nr:MazG family protein [Chloroflexota bacterium]